MKKLLLLLGTALMLSFAGCESFGGDDVVGGSYNINGAIQKGPFVQGSTITIQPLNSKLKPIGQMYTTQTTNDAGMFEMDGVNSKYAEIIATGYYYDEVEGKISASPLTLRSIADLKDGAQTNVNLLTSLTYNRIKTLVTNEGKDIAEAQKQAEKELFTALNIPPHLRPSVSCGAMNIANNGEGDGLLLALSAILQEGRSVGELTEYISKFATDLADDGRVAQALLEKFNLDGQHLLRFEGRIKENLEARYESLGIECNVPEFSQYLSYLGKPSEHYIIPFTYYEDDEKKKLFPEHPDIAPDLSSIKDGFVFSADVDYIGYGFRDGYGEIYLSAAPTVINACRCDVLRTIDIPDGVTIIGASAFEGDKCLEKLGVPDSVTEFGDRAFYDCLSLTDINIPYQLTAIGAMAFFNCWNITSVKLPNGFTNTLNQGTFCNCKSLKNVKLPESLEWIDGCNRVFDIYGNNKLDGYGAFQGCESLTTIDIPEKVYWIGISAFEGCTSLTNINFIKSESLPYNFGERAFYGCSSLTSIELSVGLLNPYVFYGCSSLTSVTFPEDSIAYINVGTFSGCTNLKSIYFPADCGGISSGAFENCVNLSDISITSDSKIEHIDHGAFYGCSSLESFTIPDGISYVGMRTFFGCTSLKNIHIPESVEAIDDYAFYGCTSLTDVTIPENVTYIGYGAFIECTSLTNINIPDKVTSIGNDAFRYCTGLTNVTIGDGVTSIGNAAFRYCTGLTNVTIGDGVTSIGHDAFSYCSSLESITIPEGVKHIGCMAFAYSGLTEVTLPSTLSTLEYGAFGWCSSLTNVYCKPTTPPSITSYNGIWEAFIYDDLLSAIYVPTESVEAYKAAEGWSDYADSIVGYDF